MKLYIKTHNETAHQFYSEHGHFHDGDALPFSCEPEDGKAYYLFPRSSISKSPLRMANSIGLIDGGYRGEIMAVCDNIKSFSYIAEKGQRLFQLVATDSSPIHYKLVNELSETSRGSGGFGSTGK